MVVEYKRTDFTSPKIYITIHQIDLLLLIKKIISTTISNLITTKKLHLLITISHYANLYNQVMEV